MAVKLHQPVAGLNPGDTYIGPMEQFLLAQGYASEGPAVDTADVLTDVAPDGDPRLAGNREAPGAATEVMGELTGDVQPLEPQALPPLRNAVVGLDEDEDVTAANAEPQAVATAVEKAPAPAAPKGRTRVVGDTEK